MRMSFPCCCFFYIIEAYLEKRQKKLENNLNFLKFGPDIRDSVL
jgi:hypothetical protein